MTLNVASGACLFALVLIYSSTEYSDGVDDAVFLTEDDLRNAMSPHEATKDTPPTTDPFTVQIAVFVINFHMDPTLSSMTADFYFRQTWNDTRLSGLRGHAGYKGRARAPASAPSIIWTPDTFFRNAIKAESWDDPHSHVFVGIKSDGNVWYTQRLTVTFPCPEMSLRSDSLSELFTCSMMLESFAYSSDHMMYEWMISPLQVDTTAMVGMSSFHFAHFEPSKCGEIYISGDHYSCLKMDLSFVHTYSPRHLFSSFCYVLSWFLVVFSWVPLWLDADTLPHKFIISVTIILIHTVLALGVVTFESGVGRSSLLVWLTSCSIFCILSVLVTIVTHVLLTALPATIKQLRSGDSAVEWVSERTSRMIDVGAGFILPLVFIIYTVIFFIIINV